MAKKSTANAAKKTTETATTDVPKRKRGRPPKPKYATDEFLEKRADEIIKIAEKYGVEQNYFFITTFSRYRDQLKMLAELKKSLNDEGLTVKKEYVKSRGNLYIHPAVDAYSKVSNAANQTVSTLINILKKFSDDSDDGNNDELLEALGIK